MLESHVVVERVYNGCPGFKKSLDSSSRLGTCIVLEEDLKEGESL